MSDPTTVRIRRGLATGLAVVLLTGSVPATALAQTRDEPPPPSSERVVDQPARRQAFERIKARVIEAIERRLGALDRLANAVRSAGHLSPDHAAALQTDIAQARARLESGLREVRATENLEQLREVGPAIFKDTLVFALLGPKTHEVIASDTVVAVTDRLGSFASGLQEAIDRLADAGIDVTEARAALGELERLIDVAAETAGPVAGRVIGLSPADWPDPATATLARGRADLKSAHQTLRQARNQAHEVIRLIREAAGANDA